MQRRNDLQLIYCVVQTVVMAQMSTTLECIVPTSACKTSLCLCKIKILAHTAVLLNKLLSVSN